jgi:hypothetical protein
MPSATGNGRGILIHGELTNLTTEHTLNYDKKWSDNSSLLLWQVILTLKI